VRNHHTNIRSPSLLNLAVFCNPFAPIPFERYRKLGPEGTDAPQKQAAWKKKLHKEAERLIDTPYEQNFSDFIKAWCGEDEYAKWLLSYLGGTLAEGATKGEDLNSIFCSELAAHLMKHMGLMDPKYERDANGYLPKDFSSQGNAHLALKAPFTLAVEKRSRTTLVRSLT